MSRGEKRARAKLKKDVKDSIINALAKEMIFIGILLFVGPLLFDYIGAYLQTTRPFSITYNPGLGSISLLVMFGGAIYIGRGLWRLWIK